MINDENEEKSIIKFPNEKTLEKKDDISSRGLQIANSIHIETEYALSEEEYGGFRERLNLLMRSIGKIPLEFIEMRIRNPHEINGGFDANSYFQAFEKLRIKSGYVLDYIYMGDHHGGEPYLYARKDIDKPIDTEEEYFSRYSLKKPTMLLGEDPGLQGRRPYLNYIIFEKSFLGFFQFAVFCILAHRFYLNWHSCYNTHSIILTKTGLEKYHQVNNVGLTPDLLSKIKCLDYHPSVKVTGKEAKVKILSFDPYGGGLNWLSINIGWPNSYYGMDQETIVRGSSYLF